METDKAILAIGLEHQKQDGWDEREVGEGARDAFRKSTYTAVRARFRHGFDKPQALVPGQVEKLRFDLSDLNHSFRRGHRLMVQVQSSWFPLIDRNPQSFVRIRSARPEDFQTATQTVYRGAAQASRIQVLVVDPARAQVPAKP